MTLEQYIQENCHCGIDKNGNWSEELFDEFGCTCPEDCNGE